MSSLVQRLSFRCMIPEILLQHNANNAQELSLQQSSSPQHLKTMSARVGVITCCGWANRGALSRKLTLNDNNILQSGTLLFLISKRASIVSKT